MLHEVTSSLHISLKRNCCVYSRIKSPVRSTTKGCGGTYKVRKSNKKPSSSNTVRSRPDASSAPGKSPSTYQVSNGASESDWEALLTKHYCAPPKDSPDALDYCAVRLRYILHQLSRGDLPVNDLKKNLEYAALVLETAYMDETRRICDEDEEDLSEVSPDSVPEEVREWLTSTFTRQVQVRPIRRFKTVANAIRTGIMFDKIFKRMSGGTASLLPIPEHVQPALRGISSWEFDIFKLNEVSDGNALKYVGFELFNRYGLLQRFKISHSILDRFIMQLQAGYRKHNNPYHNLVHGADVTQTCHWMLTQTGLVEIMSELEIFACLFAAMIHDYEHTGHTNNFHVQSGSDFALFYNDRSVLENHHISASFRLLKESDKNILSCLSREEYREFRNLVIEVVLATDMSTHFVQVKTMKSMLSLPEGIDKIKALCLMLHCCDISHPSKPWKVHSRWTYQVLEEFFRQGDLEASLGLPYSPLCDRNSVHIAESQIGFIDFIVEPSMMVCGEMLVKMVEPLVVPNLDESSQNGDESSNQGSNASSGRSTPRKSKVPLNADGKLNMPQPWIQIMQDNKNKWKEQAAIEDEARKVEDKK